MRFPDYRGVDTRGMEMEMSKRAKIFAAVGVLVVIAAIGIWYFVIRDNSPASVNSVESEEARDEALDAASGDGAVLDTVDGTWIVDTSIGEFNDACLTEVCTGNFAGFRIDEVLSSIGAKTVVGRTPGVEGTMTIAGASIDSAEFLIDMTGLITDSGARNGQLKTQAIETNAFPEASFVLTSPIDLGAVPADGEAITVDASGDLTVHGVTNAVTIPLTAELNGNIVVVFGELDVLLSDYDIDAPRAPVVVSVEDHSILEVQLFFTKG